MSSEDEADSRAWPAVWALVIGFFMILVDTTIVSVAIERIMTGLNTDVNTALWVTSAYLLAFAVPLLISGRLGDRFGQKNVYLWGLAVFTLASLGCGLAGSIGQLVFWRVVQGLGAALMTPQTMSVITRLFPPARRGAALGVWGAVAGAATLVGPIAGGVLTDAFGWEWIFFINVPIGAIGIVAAWRLVPQLPRSTATFDWPGVALSGVAMFLLVFGLQESGQAAEVALLPAPVALGLAAAGLLLLGAFVWWQHRVGERALVPLALFHDRNFSLAAVTIFFVGMWVTTFSYPLILFLQLVHGLSPTQCALLLAPQAILSGVFAPLVGRMLYRVDPRAFAIPGLGLNAVALVWLVWLVWSQANPLLVLLPSVLLGFGNAMMWGPISFSATRNLAGHRAGAGSGVYNTTRQVGAVLGTAAVAALMSALLAARAPEAAGTTGEVGGPTRLPEALAAPYAESMAQAMLLPTVACLAALAVVFFFSHARPERAPGRAG